MEFSIENAERIENTPEKCAFQYKIGNLQQVYTLEERISRSIRGPALVLLLRVSIEMAAFVPRVSIEKAAISIEIRSSW